MTALDKGFMLNKQLLRYLIYNISALYAKYMNIMFIYLQLVFSRDTNVFIQMYINL